MSPSILGAQLGIISAMATLTSISVVLTLLLCGGYAGMILMCQIGVLPAMRLLSPGAFADAWRAMDTYMDRLMPPFKGSLLILNAVAAVLLAFGHRTVLALAAGLSLALSIAGLVLTIRGQLPLNARLKTLGPNASADLLVEIREATVRGFTVRFWLAAAAFVVLSVAVVL